MDKQNPSIRVLFIAYAFPPSAEVGGRRIASFCRYLPTFGVVPIVLTVEERHVEKSDPSYPGPQGLQVERTKILTNPLQWYGRLKKRALPHTSRNASEKALPIEVTRSRRAPSFGRHLLALLNLPDGYLGWYPPASGAGDGLMEKERIAAIVSSGPPWTAHLIARHLRKKYGAPWAADFRDPWSNNPMLSQDPKWFRQANYKMEENCIGWSDLVIANTESLRRSFVRRYSALPATKFVTLTNGFNDLTVTRVERAKRSRRLLLHLGTLYGNRRIDTFCLAVRMLVESGKFHPNSLKILFVGEGDPSFQAVAHQLVPNLLADSCIEFAPPVSWQEGQELASSADVLLLFQGDFREQVPAKFYEYLPTGRPIFAVTEKGALSDLLESTRSGLWADPGDPRGIAGTLLQVLDLPALAPDEASQRWRNQFHFRFLTEQLATWLHQLAARHSPRTRMAP